LGGQSRHLPKHFKAGSKLRARIVRQRRDILVFNVASNSTTLRFRILVTIYGSQSEFLDDSDHNIGVEVSASDGCFFKHFRLKILSSLRVNISVI